MLTLIGYLPKRIQAPPEGLVLPGVSEIWSVSACISKAPEDYFQHWRHNALWLFDSVQLARLVVGSEEGYTVVGYRGWHERYDDGVAQAADFAARIGAVEAEPGYRSIGFDVVSASTGVDFEHSPLSCNSAAKQLSVNPFCLFDVLDEAIEAAKAFSSGPWEPGPYYIVEVLAPAVDP